MNVGTKRGVEGMCGGSAAAQKLEIIAFDEGNRIVDQAICGAPSVGVLPLDGWKLGVFRTQNDFGDVARAAAHVVNVEGVKKLNETVLALHRQPQRLGKEADGLAVQAAHEARRDVEPKIDRGETDRQENHGTLSG